MNDMVFQSPGGFEATQKGYFYQRARDRDIRLARRVINGEKIRPASNALWFFRPSGDCPDTWYNQTNTGTVTRPIASLVQLHRIALPSINA